MNRSWFIFLLIGITLLTGCGEETKNVDALPENEISQSAEPIVEDAKERESISKELQDRLFTGEKISWRDDVLVDLDRDGQNDSIRIEIEPDPQKEEYEVVKVYINDLEDEFHHMYKASSTMKCELITYDGKHLALLLICNDAVGYYESYIIGLSNGALFTEYVWGEILGYDTDTGRLYANTLICQIDWHPVQQEYEIKMEDTGAINLVEYNFYMTYMQEPRDAYKTVVDVMGFEEMSTEAVFGTIPAGTTMELIGGDGKAWVYVYLPEQDVYCYVKVENAKINTSNGEVQSIYEVFEGLMAVS